MEKPDKPNVVMVAITAILWAFIGVVVVGVIMSASGCLPEWWGW